MSEAEKIAGVIFDQCLMDCEAAFWFDRQRATAIIKAALAAETKRADEAVAEAVRLKEGIKQFLAWSEAITYSDISRRWVCNRLAALLQPKEAGDGK